MNNSHGYYPLKQKNLSQFFQQTLLFTVFVVCSLGTVFSGLQFFVLSNNNTGDINHNYHYHNNSSVITPPPPPPPPEPISRLSTNKHPLTALTAKEIKKAKHILTHQEESFPEGPVMFSVIERTEPTKDEMATFELSGVAPNRKANITVLSVGDGASYSAVVDLTAETVVSWEVVPFGMYPPGLPDVGDALSGFADAIANDENFVLLMQSKGVTDFSLLAPYQVAPGSLDGSGACEYLMTVNETTSLFGYIGIAYMNSPGCFQNPENCVIPGLLIAADFTGNVLGVFDAGLPFDPHAPAPELQTKQHIVELPPQVLTRNLTVDANFSVRWGDWSFLLSNNPRHGLTFYNLTFKGDKIIYSSYLSDIAVLYGDDSPDFVVRIFEDLAQFRAMYSQVGLIRGAEAPLNAEYLTIVNHDNGGSPFEVKDAIAIWEEGSGGLVSKMGLTPDLPNLSEPSLVSGRHLAVRWTLNAGQYDYTITTHLHDWGKYHTIADAHGMVHTLRVEGSTYQTAPGIDERSGYIVAPGVLGVSHQHAFTFRVDLDVLGQGNVVTKQDFRANEESVCGSEIVRDKHVLSQEGGYLMDPKRFRRWTVHNPSSAYNEMGYPRAYIFDLHMAGTMLSHSPHVNAILPHLRKNIYFTKYHYGEWYASGRYPMMRTEDLGLNHYASDNENIANKDIVAWVNLLNVHWPDSIDWPYIIQGTYDFAIKPYNFKKQNPVL